MAVTYIDPGQGALAEGIATAGTGLALRLTEKQRKEREIASDFGMMQNLANAYRQAEKAGQGQVFLEGIGVRPEFGSKLASVPETFAQAREREGMALGEPAALARATTGEAQLAGTMAEEQIAQNVPRLLTDKLVSETLFSRDSFDALRGLDIPQLSAMGTLEDIKAGIQENKYRGTHFEIRNNAGFPQLVVDAEKSKLLLGIQEDELMSGQIDQYVNWLNRIDQSTPAGRHRAMMANTFMMNPGFAGYLAQLEFLDHRALLAQSGSDPIAAAKFAMDIQGEMDRRLSELRAVASSNLSSSQKRAQMNALGMSLNNIVDMHKDLQRVGILPPTDYTRYDLQRRVLQGELFTTDQERLGAMDYFSGLYGSGDDPGALASIVRGHIEDIDRIALAGELSEKEKRDFLIFLTDTLGDLEEAARPKRNPIIDPNETVGQTLSRWIPRLLEMFPSGGVQYDPVTLEPIPPR